MSHDIVMQQTRNKPQSHGFLSEKQLEYKVLKLFLFKNLFSYVCRVTSICLLKINIFFIEVDKLLRCNGKSLKQFGQLPQPPAAYLQTGCLINDETSYGVQVMDDEFGKLFLNCNAEQLEVYNAVMDSVDKGEGGIFCLW